MMKMGGLWGRSLLPPPRQHPHHLFLPCLTAAAPGHDEQRATLVNVRIKWVKDRSLDAVVARERHLRPALDLVHAIASSHDDPLAALPTHHLSRFRRQLRLPETVPSVPAFMRRHPTIFHVSRRLPPSSSVAACGRPFRWFGLTAEALRLHREEMEIRQEIELELVDRLRKLLMLSAGSALPLPVVDQLRWDLGLPPDYQDALIPRYPNFFRLDAGGADPRDDRVWLRLLSWDDRLAVSRLQRDAIAEACSASAAGGHHCLAFPVRFTRGFGLKRKCTAWLEEWQRLPYTSPYDTAAAGRLDPRTDVAEKRVVGVFHELLHLTLGKKTERGNLSNLRKSLELPYKFTKVFGRHPGIFYLSEKLATQTVVLREAYGGGRELLDKHPLVGIRERYTALMRAETVDGSRESHRKTAACADDGGGCNDLNGSDLSSEEYEECGSDCNLFYEGDSVKL